MLSKVLPETAWPTLSVPKHVEERFAFTPVEGASTNRDVPPLSRMFRRLDTPILPAPEAWSESNLAPRNIATSSWERTIRRRALTVSESGSKADGAAARTKI
jgi:hypothetical protein